MPEMTQPWIPLSGNTVGADGQHGAASLPRASRLARTLPVLLAVLLACALRVYHLDFQSLWGDEGISLLRAGLPFDEMLRTLPAEHVPGYWVVLRWWVALAGTTDFALRYLSVLPSVLAIAFAYRLAADLGSRRAGLIAALLLATSTFQVWYAQEARMYAGLMATGIGATWLLWRLLTSRRPLLPVAGYVLLVSAAINLHFYGFLVPLAHAAFLVGWLWHTRDARAALRWVAASLAVLLLYLPWVPRLLAVPDFQGCCPAPPPGLLPWRYLTAYTAGDAMPPSLRAWIPWVYLALAALGGWAWSRRSRLGGWLLLTATLVPLAAALAIALVTRDFYHERYGCMLSIPLAVLAAGGFAALQPQFASLGRLQRTLAGSIGSRWVAGLLLAGLLGANLLALHRLYTDTTLHKADFRAIVRRIERAEQPGDIILVHGLDPREVFLHYYRGGLPVHNVHPLRSLGDAEIAANLSALTAGAGHLWMVHYDPPTTAIEYWLAAHAWLADRTRYGNENLTLSVYGLPNLPQRELPQGATFGEALRLTRAVVAGGSGDGLDFRAGDLLGLTTTWDVLEPPPSLTFSLRLLDAEGRAWITDDYVPLEGASPTAGWPAGGQVEDRRGLLLPTDLAPGSYTLALLLYDPDTGAPVPVGASDRALIARLSVAPSAVPPDPADLPIPRRVQRQIGDQVELLGFDMTPQPLIPGQGATLTVWWRATGRPAEAYWLRAQASRRGGQAAFAGVYPLSRAPTDTWQPGQVVREHYPLAVDPAAVTGVYRVVLALATADGDPYGPSVTLGNVAVAARSRVYRLPRRATPLEVALGESIRLRGYELTLPEATGGELSLTLYWQAAQRVAGDFKVFVHLVDESGRIAAQADAIPADGTAPTDGWLPGEVVADRHGLAAPRPGRYRLLTGLYDPGSGDRLPAVDAAGRPLPENAVPIGDVILP